MNVQAVISGRPVRLRAIEHVGRLPAGGSGAQLYRVAEAAEKYVVKLKASGQGVRVLFNEYVCGRLGEIIGVPLGRPRLVDVADHLLPPDGTPNIAGRQPGLQFGTAYFEDSQGDVTQLKLARNYELFPSVVVFDTFIALGNGRQHLLYPSGGSGTVRDMAAIFDQGYALTGCPNWTHATLAAAPNCVVKDDLKIKDDFPRFAAYEPFIVNVESLTRDQLETIVNEVPLAEWAVSAEEASAVAAWLDGRKGLVRPAMESYLR